MIEASRSPDQATTFPLAVGDTAWVGVQRIHALSHPGLNFLVVTDGSLRSQSATSVGSYLARIAHARMTLLGIGNDQPLMDTYLQDARKQMGSGMASIEVRTYQGSTASAVGKSIEKEPVDLVIVGWRPIEGAEIAEQILRMGDHHLLLAAKPVVRIEKALVCVASGEPGKDDVMFAGRLLRHLGASAKLLTVLDGNPHNESQSRQVVRFVAGGVHSLEMFGVPTQSELKTGDPQTEIVEEIKKGEFDLIVLGAPFPQRDGRIAINGVIEGIMKNAGNCSLLIVRSHYHKNSINQN